MALNRAIHILVLVIIVELAIVVLLASPESLSNARDQEHQVAIDMFGPMLAQEAKVFANTAFTSHFIDTGAVAFTEDLFIPTEEQKHRAPELSKFRENPVFQWAKSRIDAVWVLIYGAYHRAYMIGLSVLFTGALIICCLVDALVQRKINIVNNNISNSVYYHGAKRLLALLIFLPLAVAVAPLPITEPALIAWMIILPLTIWVGARNVQEI